jgi:hypothetical protein
MFSQKVAIGLNATSSISQPASAATSIGSSAGSTICQLPSNATSIGVASLSSNTQISFSGEPAGQGPVGVTEPTFYVTGVTGVTGPTGATGANSEPTTETTIVLEEKAVNNACCVKWF